MQNMLNPNKNFVSVLMSGKDKGQEADPETVNPDQGMIDASKELLKAIDKKDPERIARVFKAMMNLCDDDEGAEEDSEQE